MTDIQLEAAALAAENWPKHTSCADNWAYGDSPGEG